MKLQNYSTVQGAKSQLLLLMQPLKGQGIEPDSKDCESFCFGPVSKMHQSVR